MKINYLCFVVIVWAMVCGMECVKENSVTANTKVNIKVTSALQDVLNVAISLRGTITDPVPVPGITVYLYKKGDYSASTTLAIASLKLNSIDKQDSNNKGECSFTIKESGEYVIEAYYKIGAIGTEKRKSAEVGAAPGADPVTKTVELLLD